MFSQKSLKDKFSKVSAKTLTLAGSKYLRDRNEKAVGCKIGFRKPSADQYSDRLQ